VEVEVENCYLHPIGSADKCTPSVVWHPQEDSIGTLVYWPGPPKMVWVMTYVWAITAGEGSGQPLTSEHPHARAAPTGLSLQSITVEIMLSTPRLQLKVHKIENFFGSDFEFGVISLFVMLKY
jgi:hypothetical protein